jgi:hypothetical protein
MDGTHVGGMASYYHKTPTISFSQFANPISAVAPQYSTNPTTWLGSTAKGTLVPVVAPDHPGRRERIFLWWGDDTDGALALSYYDRDNHLLYVPDHGPDYKWFSASPELISALAGAFPKEGA